MLSVDQYPHAQYSSDHLAEYPTPPSFCSHSDSLYTSSSSYTINYALPTFEYQNSYPMQPMISPSPLSLDDGMVDFYAHDAPPFTPPENEQNMVVSISTSFHPDTHPSPDTVLHSIDGVLFYVHLPTIKDPCPEAFQPYSYSSVLSIDGFSPGTNIDIIAIDAPSSELNIILHALHGSSPAVHSPDFDTLITAIDRMPTYNIPPRRFVCPSKPLYDLLLAYIPSKALELFALDAFHDIHTLAVTASAHLHEFKLMDKISDSMAQRIGSRYMRKLCLLRCSRSEALRNIMLRPFSPHPPSKVCGFDEQKKVTRAWALASAHIAWDQNPDISLNAMKNALKPYTEHITCRTCQQTLQERIKTVVVQWASIKHTI